jgi:GH15 family glucan-1,4-alpha-glucosidase
VRTQISTGSEYLPIADYAAIGNLRTIALVGRHGGIDWCCLPELDSPSVFAALLDARRGGSFRIAPAHGPTRGGQRYLDDTNVLQTRFEGDDSLLEITDFMPLAGTIEGRQGARGEPEIHRIVRAVDGAADVLVHWAPRFDYARVPPRIVPAEHGWIAAAGERQLTMAGITRDEAALSHDADGPVLRARLRLRAGERRLVVVRWHEADARVDRASANADLERSLRLLDDTCATWQRWVRTTRTRRDDAFAPLLTRSALVLKLLTHRDSGAIAAAATTSLPERIGGVRNWDYRYTWIRDASLTAQALISLGHAREALEFLLWVERVSEARARDDWQLQIMYGMHGESDLAETVLEHLEGYCGSRPVRIGNAAATQVQLDVYGELLGSAYELVRRGIELDAPLKRFLAQVADRAVTHWREPDYGIWEMRRDPLHFVYSKVMVWVALDRAVHLARRGTIHGDVATWRRERDAIRAEVLARGFDARIGSFVQAYDSDALDAANLLLPIYEFLPFDDSRVRGTIDRTLERLTENDLVYRYHADDGLPGGEGAFGLCTFWLADSLALSGRLDEAWRIFDGIARRANHVGLFAEQFDPHSGAFLGNFPQAFTHIGFINSALYLAYAEGRAAPGPPLIGTDEHRREAGHDVTPHP